MYIILSWSEHVILGLIVYLSMYLIYHIELPFFERYKISNEPWPW
jgi:hypothetical protein